MFTGFFRDEWTKVAGSAYVYSWWGDGFRMLAAEQTCQRDELEQTFDIANSNVCTERAVSTYSRILVKTKYKHAYTKAKDKETKRLFPS
jgi:hypothetical protein